MDYYRPSNVLLQQRYKQVKLIKTQRQKVLVEKLEQIETNGYYNSIVIQKADAELLKTRNARKIIDYVRKNELDKVNIIYGANNRPQFINILPLSKQNQSISSTNRPIVIKLYTELDSSLKKRIFEKWLEGMKREFGIKKVEFDDYIWDAKFYVVTIDSFFNGVAKNIVKWSNNQIEHIKIPDDAKDKSIDYLVKELEPANKTTFGIALLMIIGVHGVGNNAYVDLYGHNDGNYFIKADNNSKNRIYLKTLKKIKEAKIKFMANSVSFVSACNAGKEYELELGKDKKSFVGELSEITGGYATGATDICSGQSGPDSFNKTYKYHSKNFKTFHKGKYFNDLGSDVYTKDFYLKALKNAKNIIEKIKKEDDELLEEMKKRKGNFKLSEPIK